MNIKKKSTLKKVAAGVGIAIVVGGGVYYLMDTKLKKVTTEYDAIIEEKDSVINLYTSDVIPGLVLLRDIEPGEVIKESDLAPAYLPRINSPEDLLTDLTEVVGKEVKLALKTNMALTSGMVYDPKELTDDVRRVEYDYVRLPLMLKKTDFIEIEIVFPNGVSKSIVPKAKLTALDLTKNYIFMNLNQEFRFLMDAAWVDMVVWEAEVRAVQYVDGVTQEEGRIEYMPNPEVIKLLKTDPGLVAEAKARYTAGESVRMILEEALAKIMEEKPYKRFGANLPEGSYVAQRNSGSGAGIIVVNPDSTTSGEITEEVQQSIDQANQNLANENVQYNDPSFEPTPDDLISIPQTDPNTDAGTADEGVVDEVPEIGAE